VASDFKSSMLIVPLLDKASATGHGINYYRSRSCSPAA
jgi:hypothetical protein